MTLARETSSLGHYIAKVSGASAPFFLYLHLNFWPGKIVILLSNFDPVEPNDTVCIIPRLVGQVPAVEVVPVEV